jgi:hypothetical protein
MFGVLVIVMGVLLTTFGGYLAKDAWDTLKHPRKAEESSPQKTREIQPGSGDLLPDQIIKEIDARPPFQRTEAAQNYIGMKVTWRLTFYSVRLINDTKARLMLKDRGSYPWIYCDIDIPDYPAIKITQEGAELRVSGRIADVADNVITLTDVSILNP